MRMLAERIDDQAILRLIKKWLKAGVLDTDGKVLRPEGGTPQGGIISPILAKCVPALRAGFVVRESVREAVEARPSYIDTQTTSSAASGGKKMRNGSTRVGTVCEIRTGTGGGKDTGDPV